MTGKIIDRKKIKKIVLKLRKKGKKVGLANGVFDILHAGHVTYLEKAKQKCDFLIVSLNTDDSVKKNKGKGRPINKLKDRQKVIAALEAVDYVTSHKETKMRKSLEIIKPSYYIKGGDYKVSQLTSRDVVEKYGGKVILIPMVKGKSTTGLLESIKKKIRTKKIKKKNKAIILDRDGTINEEVYYLHEPHKLKIIHGVIKGLKKFRKLGYKLVIITNQPGIGVGYFTKEDFFRVNKAMLKIFSKNNILIDKIYFCPHSMSEGCKCRKPGIELFKRAEKDLNLDMKNSYFIGDMTSDIMAGKRAGCKTILVKTGQKGLDGKYKVKPDFVVRNMLEASKYIS